MKAIGITIISLALTTAVIGNAYYQKKQFYPSVVYITKSNPSMAVIYIQAFILVLLMGKLMRKVFFGQLRAAEFEHLMERAWYAVTETCLAFTVFRDDFNPKFVALFTVLLFLKSFHWLADDRVDYMERSPIISWVFHMRVLSLLVVLGSLDLHFIGHAYQSTISKGASVQLVFGFEYAILITMVVNIGIKYVLHSVDLNSENPWENKAVFLLYTELIMGFIKVILYLTFVSIMIRIYTLPLFAFRPMYFTMRNFKKAFNDVILSRRAIRNMNTLYPDATAQELQAADNVCIICREEMTTSTSSKKLPCNHIFHTSCLRSWFQRQQTCPTCRLNILRPNASQIGNQRQRGGAAAPAVNRAAPAAAAAGGGVPLGNQPQPQVPPAFPAFANAYLLAAAAPGIQIAAPPPVPTPIPNPTPGPAPPPPATAAAGGGAGGSTSASQTNAANGQQQTTPQTNIGASNVPRPPNPQFIMPPFAFVPFLTAPPIIPRNLQSLSTEELQQMEGNERANIEARIQCLRNIQIMLDAAVLMMQQYSSAANVKVPLNVRNSTTAEKSSPKASASADSPPTSSPARAMPSTSETARQEMQQQQQASSSNGEDELRRRRLQHFEQQQ